jgi:hypothetical protein
VKVWADPTERFDAILQGLLDQGRYHLIGSPEFELLKQKSLRRQPASRADAASIVASLAATLAPLAGSLADKSMVALVQSPLVSQALTQQLGRSGRLVAAEFQRLKSTSAAPYADPAACWMAALYGRTLLNAVARPEVADTDRSTALQTRRALTRARQLYQGSTPPA